MDRRRLPVGIQTFRRIREEGYYYVDKTAFARRIAAGDAKHYFLSRPTPAATVAGVAHRQDVGLSWTT